MFVISLRFTDKTKAPPLMDRHKAWIKRGFEDGVFLVAGSLQPNAGGAILAHKVSRTEIDARLQDDPFVAEGVVSAEVLEVTPGLTDDRLAFLKPEP